MDNALIHHSARVQQMCADAGVILIYLPPCSPDFNPRRVFCRTETVHQAEDQRFCYVSARLRQNLSIRYANVLSASHYVTIEPPRLRGSSERLRS